MVSKFQRITALYESTIQAVMQNPAAWTSFLGAACRNYKCRFDEQILIYAQRPEATAVLEIERWNKLFGRWVNRGAMSRNRCCLKTCSPIRPISAKAPP